MFSVAILNTTALNIPKHVFAHICDNIGRISSYKLNPEVRCSIMILAKEVMVVSALLRRVTASVLPFWEFFFEV